VAYFKVLQQSLPVTTKEVKKTLVSIAGLRADFRNRSLPNTKKDSNFLTVSVFHLPQDVNVINLYLISKPHNFLLHFKTKEKFSFQCAFLLPDVSKTVS
jgi:hypothetical protein